jgi:hypothetical protein
MCRLPLGGCSNPASNQESAKPIPRIASVVAVLRPLDHRHCQDLLADPLFNTISLGMLCVFVLSNIMALPARFMGLFRIEVHVVDQVT